jgi:uncharacterized membrane protein
MRFALTSPAALWLLLAIPAVWFALRGSRTNFNPRQKYLQAAVRSLLLAALALALARPVISTGSSRVSIVYVVDVSHSIASRALTSAASQIDQINASLHPDHSRVVVFGGAASSVPDTAALTKLASPPAAGAAAAVPVSQEASDLERALMEARAELLPGRVPRIVLFTDGRETSGAVRDALTRLAAEGIPVFTEPLAVRDLGDTWVDGLQVPDRVFAGGLVAATVHVGSQRETTATVQVRAGGAVLAAKTVPVPAGGVAVPLDLTFPNPGAARVDVTVSSPGDPLEANNTFAREVLVRAPSRVLYVEGAPASARYLQSALQQSGFEVSVEPPAAMPSTVEQLEPWDVVILSDVARRLIPDATMTSLATWVEQEGGGLLIAGGESVFGEGNPGEAPGYRKTELERLTPVTFERKDIPEVALIIILDKSWSMAGSVMELCKSAAQAAVDALQDEHMVGVVTFNDSLNWDVTLRNVGKNRPGIQKAIAAIEPSGHTLIYPAIDQAYLALKDAKARAKHVVLLSDGRSYPDDYEGLVKKMVAAKMTVSSIAVGPAADVELLTNIAQWGKGRSYVVQDAKEVPQIFVKEAKNVSVPSFDEGKTIKPVVKSRGFLEGVDLTRMPGLRGRTATVLKDHATQLLATEDGDPLLSFWPIGLGRTAVFASDVKDRWANDWVKWRGYGPFFSAVVHAIERQRPSPLALDVQPGAVHGDSRTITVTVDARDGKGGYRDLLKPVLQVRAGDDAPMTMTAHQVAPGRYEAKILADARRTIAVSLTGPPAGADATRLIVPDPQAEYRFRSPDVALLEAIAAATGGKFQPTLEDIARTSGAAAARRAVWPWLVVAALAFWLTDIVLRRIRLFERA